MLFSSTAGSLLQYHKMAYYVSLILPILLVEVAQQCVLPKAPRCAFCWPTWSIHGHHQCCYGRRCLRQSRCQHQWCQGMV